VYSTKLSTLQELRQKIDRSCKADLSQLDHCLHPKVSLLVDGQYSKAIEAAALSASLRELI